VSIYWFLFDIFKHSNHLLVGDDLDEDHEFWDRRGMTGVGILRVLIFRDFAVVDEAIIREIPPNRSFLLRVEGY